MASDKKTDSLTKLVSDLTPDQRAAVKHQKGPALVVAGAGTGKTTVITRRISYLVSQGLARPDEILALTFTDKAAREMEERVDLLLPYGVVDTAIMTFHSFGDRILREHGLEIGLQTDFMVMPTFSQIVFMQNLISDRKLNYYKPVGSPFSFVTELLRHFSRLKDENISSKVYGSFAAKLTRSAKDKDSKLEAAKYQELAGLYALYVEQTRAKGQIDFGDQIQLVLELFERRPNTLARYQKQYKYILVDEYQDTNLAQNQLLLALAAKHKNVMVVGDDDQAIYRFRGAAISNILSFKHSFPRAAQIVLTKNFRSNQAILDLSYRLIQHNNPDRLEVQNKIDKQLKGRSGGPKPQFLQFDTLAAEMEGVAKTIRTLIDEDKLEPREIAILLRKNNQARLITPNLRRHQIPYHRTQTASLLEQSEILILVNLTAFLSDQNNSAALYGILQSEVFTLDPHELAQVAARARASHRSLADYIADNLTDDEPIKLQLIELMSYREKISDFGAGELLYNFIQSSGYLSQLVTQAEKDNSAAAKIQNIAQFFDFVKQFELVSTQPDLIHFGGYIDEIRASAADIFADESPIDLNAVTITTIHKAKGLEFKAVFVIDVVQNTFPTTNRADVIQLPESLLPYAVPKHSHIEEERRLFYVALTRAEEYLYISASTDHGSSRAWKPSQFITEAFAQLPKQQLSTALKDLPTITQFERQPPLPFDPLDMLIVDGWLHLSVNQVADYIRSPKEFWYFHVLNLPKGPFHSLVYGSAIHASIEAYWRARINDQPIKLRDLYSVFDSNWRSEGFVSLTHEQERHSAGRAVLRHYFTQAQKSTKLPSAIEEPFLLTLPNLKLKLSGRYDAVFQDINGVEIRDYKTGSVDTEKKAKSRLKDSIQLSLYALAWDRAHAQKVISTSLHFVEHDIVVKNEIIDHERTMQILNTTVTDIRERKFDKTGKQFNFDQPF